MDELFLSILCCPKCKGKLVEKNSGLECIQCNRGFKIIDGIPELLNQEDVLGNKAKVANIRLHDSQARYYDEIHRHIEEEGIFVKEIFRGIQAEGINLLDVGTGTGFIPTNILEQGRRIFCLDISRALLKEALEKLKGRCSYGIRADAENLPLADETIDIITSSSLLHHLPNYQKCLEEMGRVLKKNGTLVIFHEPRKLLKSFVYKLLTTIHYQLELLRPNKRRDKVKYIASKMFVAEAEDAYVQLRRLESETHFQEGFEPYNLLGNRYQIKEIKVYYAHRCLFNKFLELCFPGRGELFYIIAKKIN